MSVAVDEKMALDGQKPGSTVGARFKLVEEAIGSEIGFLN